MLSPGIIAWQVQLDAGVLWILCGIALVWLIAGVFVYKDAETRGMSGIAWFFVVLIGGLIGIIVYLVVRHDRQPAVALPPTWASFRPHVLRQPAGSAPPPSAPPKVPEASPARASPGAVGRSCPSCEANIPVDAAFCPNCGKPIA